LGSSRAGPLLPRARTSRRSTAQRRRVGGQRNATREGPPQPEQPTAGERSRASPGSRNSAYAMSASKRATGQRGERGTGEPAAVARHEGLNGLQLRHEDRRTLPRCGRELAGAPPPPPPPERHRGWPAPQPPTGHARRTENRPAKTSAKRSTEQSAREHFRGRTDKSPARTIRVTALAFSLAGARPAAQSMIARGPPSETREATQAASKTGTGLWPNSTVRRVRGTQRERRTPQPPVAPSNSSAAAILRER